MEDTGIRDGLHQERRAIIDGLGTALAVSPGSAEWRDTLRETRRRVEACLAREDDVNAFKPCAESRRLRGLLPRLFDDCLDAPPAVAFMAYLRLYTALRRWAWLRERAGGGRPRANPPYAAGQRSCSGDAGRAK